VNDVAEPQRSDGNYVYTTYLRENGAGDEFRGNEEVLARFFDDQGRLKPEAASELHGDISRLLLPSPERALALNKAYREVVREQSYVRGRDAVITPATNVHQSVNEGQGTGIARVVTADGLLSDPAARL
jgi:hypothetical protein